MDDPFYYKLALSFLQRKQLNIRYNPQIRQFEVFDATGVLASDTEAVSAILKIVPKDFQNW